jgi:hypothetical protein
MTSPIHEFVWKLTESKLFARALESLQTEVRDALQDFAADDKPSLIRRGPLASRPLYGTVTRFRTVQGIISKKTSAECLQELRVVEDDGRFDGEEV